LVKAKKRPDIVIDWHDWSRRDNVL